MDKSEIAGIRNIFEDVKRIGDKALIRYILKFDKLHIKPIELEVKKSDIKASLKKVKPSVVEALQKSAKNIENFYNKEKSHITREWGLTEAGKKLTQKVVPLDSVGVYVPGGKYSYPSSVLMAAIPAKIAGVGNIYVVSPPARLSDEVLAACFIAGVDRVFRVGGPCAVAALAYGTKTIPKVDKIVGPGNKYVTAAKSLVFGDTGIDMLAGPSEIVIIADETADLEYIKADLAAQLEHDENSAAFLIVVRNKSKFVKNNLPKRVKLIYAKNIEDAAEISDNIAPEHLLIMCKNARTVADKIHNAGAIFIGSYSPVALGDYTAGPSHVLPTMGSARFSSGLSVQDFLKRINIIEYNSRKCVEEGVYAARIAGVEGMVEHKKSVELRKL